MNAPAKQVTLVLTLVLGGCNGGAKFVAALPPPTPDAGDAAVMEGGASDVAAEKAGDAPTESTPPAPDAMAEMAAEVATPPVDAADGGAGDSATDALALDGGDQ